MLDREQMIEEAQRVAFDAYRRVPWGKDAWEAVAEAVFAVFEQSSAPTDQDDREALEHGAPPRIMSPHIITGVAGHAPAERSDDYEAGYTEGFHDGLSTPRGSAEDDRTPTEHPEPPKCTCSPASIVSDGPNVDCPIHGADRDYYRDESKRWEDRAYEYSKRADAAEAKLARIAGVLDDDERSSVILAVIRGIIYDDKEGD
ncbi:hypothetical protein [Microbacterium terrisoli]|uniref:hypothetical protein n=1 Tax=Microbacterium terrisoli TaxID=3242192 RepID=UPI002805B8DD|nr:hypothetical protein [Microbacterium protaetiae]